MLEVLTSIHALSRGGHEQLCGDTGRDRQAGLDRVDGAQLYRLLAGGPGDARLLAMERTNGMSALSWRRPRPPPVVAGRRGRRAALVPPRLCPREPKLGLRRIPSRDPAPARRRAAANSGPR